MRLPQLPRPIVAYCVFISLCILLVKFLDSRSSANLLHEIIDSQIQHGVPLYSSSDDSKIDPFDTSTYLPEDPIGNAPNPLMTPLSQCSYFPNPFTSHIRLPIQHLNISLTPPDSRFAPGRYFNPAFLRLPSWTTKSPTANGAKYVLVTRKVTGGLHQESLICLADICLPHGQAETDGSEEFKKRSPLPQDTRRCTPSDHHLLGSHGGMRCTTPPIKLNIPPTAALRCTGPWAAFPQIAGFHDPRIFWSSRGEPLIILNSASQYGCIGLWVLDLRTVYPDLAKVLSRDAKRKPWQMPTISYSHLTELTRIGRSEVEKNWMFFFPGFEGEAIIQYDALPKYHFGVDQPQPPPSMNESLAHTKRASSTFSSSGGRTLARVVGAGPTTPNITHQDEATCFPPNTVFDTLSKKGDWHQATNALKLILCTRQQYRDGACSGPGTWTEEGREVHVSIMHRKFSNEIELPMRYERYVVVWEGRRPYRVVGVSKLPILFEGERARPWSDSENWVEVDLKGRAKKDRNGTAVESGGERSGSRIEGNWTMAVEKGPDEDNQELGHLYRKRPHDNVGQATADPARPAYFDKTNAYFTYTPSLSWAWRPAPDHFDFDFHGGDHGREDDVGDIEELETLGLGFLGDDLLVGIGLDDVEQVFVRVNVDELVSCLRLCNGVE